MGEVLLSLGLLAVVILVTVQLALVALNSNTKTSDEIAAEALAQETVETFVYQLPPATSSFWTTTSFASPYQQDVVRLGRNDLSRTIYVQDRAALQAGLRSVQVVVTWGNGERGKSGLGLQVAEVVRLVSPP